LAGRRALGLTRLLSLLLSLRACLLAHLLSWLTLTAHLLALLTLATGLLAHLALLLAPGLLAGLAHLLTLLSLAHSVELSQRGPLAVGVALIAGALALIHLTVGTLAIGSTLFGHALTRTVDDHHGATGTGTTAATRSHARVKRVIDHVDGARPQRGAFGDDVVAHLMHCLFVGAGIGRRFDRPEKVGEVFVLVTHIPALVGQLLIREIDPGKFLLKLFGVQLPSRLDGRGGKDHRVGG